MTHLSHYILSSFPFCCCFPFFRYQWRPQTMLNVFGLWRPWTWRGKRWARNATSNFILMCWNPSTNYAKWLFRGAPSTGETSRIRRNCFHLISRRHLCIPLTAAVARWGCFSYFFSLLFLIFHILIPGQGSFWRWRTWARWCSIRGGHGSPLPPLLPG